MLKCGADGVPGWSARLPRWSAIAHLQGTIAGGRIENRPVSMRTGWPGVRTGQRALPRRRWLTSPPADGERKLHGTPSALYRITFMHSMITHQAKSTPSPTAHATSYGETREHGAPVLIDDVIFGRIECTASMPAGRATNKGLRTAGTAAIRTVNAFPGGLGRRGWLPGLTTLL